MDETILLKQCKKCLQWKPATLEYFHAAKANPDGLRNDACRECRVKHLPRKVQPGFKYCPKCKRELPATLEYFHAHPRNADGLRTPCKQCRSIARPKSELKRCSQCKREFPATTLFFNKRGDKTKGVRSVCRKCRWSTEKETATKWRQANPDKVRHYSLSRRGSERERESQRRYRVTHRGVLILRRKTYYDADPQRAREQAKAYRLRYPERVRQSRMVYQQSEAGKAANRRAVIKHRLKRRVIQQIRIARKRAAQGTHTAEDIQRQFAAQNGLCYWCKKPVTKYHVDHVIPLSRGGFDDPSNLVISCPVCNWRKNNKLPEQWLKDKERYSS